MDALANSRSTRHQQLAARAAIQDAAKVHAARLRREAIDDFWSSIGRGLRSALRRLRATLRIDAGLGDQPGNRLAPRSGQRAAAR